MNKKELSELKKNFDLDSNYFTMNKIITAFVDIEKNIKCNKALSTNLISDDEREAIHDTLKKCLSGQLGKSVVEYEFPKNAYDEDGKGTFLYNTLKERFDTEESINSFIANIAENYESASNYAIIAAHCTYSVYTKKKRNSTEDDGSSYDFNFIIATICPVTLRKNGLIYNGETNSIEKEKQIDRVVGAPSEGFVFPAFSDRSADVNHVVCYTKNKKTPNLSFIENVLECKFEMSSEAQKDTFNSIVESVAGEDLSYEAAKTIKNQISRIIESKSDETELPAIDEDRLKSLLYEAGIDEDKLECLHEIYENSVGKANLTAVNLIEPKTKVEAPGVVVTVNDSHADSLKIDNFNGKKCIVIALEESAVQVNGLNLEI